MTSARLPATSDAPSDAFTVDALHDLGRDTAQRRRLSAYLLAVPESVRPSSDAIAAMLGVTPSTVRMDWTRSDVQALARSATSAGLVGLMLATARGFLVRLCERANAGDLEAGDALRRWLLDLGALGSVTTGDGDALAAEYGGSAGGALLGDDAARALADALASLP